MFDKSEIRALLIEAARARQTFTYGGMLNALGHAFTRPLMRQLCKVLDRIDEDRHANGEPGLAVLVVRQSDGLPGQGWFVARSGIYDDLPMDWEGPEARRYTQARQAEAFDYWQSARPLRAHPRPVTPAKDNSAARGLALPAAAIAALPASGS